MVRPGDFVILNDVIGCVKTLEPLTILCQDGIVRTFQAAPEIIITGQHYAALLAEKAMRRVKGGGQKTV